MTKALTTTLTALSIALVANAKDVHVAINANEGKQIIHKEIYGQFAEHLGTCIYGGLWVRPESQVPNTQGYRNDVLQALKELQIPVLRWPGGCFADEYHWMDGIGPRSQRPKMRNSWGGTIEDNSFGTHEFLNLCEMLGTEPYISGNVGSGSVEELAKWVEYMTSDGDTPMATLRRKNGRERSWNVKFLGVGNESWGCGGNMTPEYYSDLYRRYATYCRDYDGKRLYKIASGASDYDYNWTKVLMDRVGNRMHGLSLHYYTVKTWGGSKGKATTFTNQDYLNTIGKALQIEEVIKKHCELMDKKDPQKRIGLLVDEWGTWWDEELGTISGHLYQQNTMRDAMVAALTLNVFHRHTSRVRMANIAQVVNVLQSMILTDTIDGGHMVLTPTYHVFKMYRPFQDATFLPCEVQTDSVFVQGGQMVMMHDANIPLVCASAAKAKNGKIVLALVNTGLDKLQNVSVTINGANAKAPNAQILTAKKPTDHNDFKRPNVVKAEPFNGAKIKNGRLQVALPPLSVVVMEL